MALLVDNTVVRHPVTGERVVLHKGQPLPTWAEGVVNDHLLVAEPVDALVAAVSTLVDPAAEPKPEVLVPVATVDGQAENQGLAAPPRGGPGSGRDHWATYAAELGVEVTEDMVRDDIIAAIEAQA